MKTTWLPMLALVGLSACGTLRTGNPIAGIAGGVVSGIVGGGETAPTQAAPQSTGPLTRAQIEAQPTDLLRVSLISRGTTALIFKGGENGTRITWLSADGLSLTFDRGVLVGTRGLGDDVMGSDISGVLASFRGAANYQRTIDFLNGLEQIERVTFQCAMVRTGQETLTLFERNYATTIYQETCTGAGTSFKNTYWRDGNGVIWQARQWVSGGVGYLGYQRL